MGFWKFLREGVQRLWKSRWRGVELEKVFCRVILTNSSCNPNVWFGDPSAVSDPKDSRNILFTYFSPNIKCTGNDNLSSFAGHFIEENRNSKILKNEPLQHCCNKKFETPDTFLLVLQAVYITFSRPGYLARHLCHLGK